jgi:endonuclease-8
MPEGDTIFRAARTLQQALAGRTVLRFASVFPHLTRIDADSPLAGRTIESVTARGKHLLMRFSDGLVLRTHLRMHGSWHLYRPGERWQRPAREMRIMIATDAFEAVGFDVPDAEFLAGSEVSRATALRELGPDPLADQFDAHVVVARLRAHPDNSIADALLDQRAIAGIGNIFKSETLFAARVSPFASIAALAPEQLLHIVETAAKLLRGNVTGRVRFSVYERAGEPCRRCGTPISRQKQGPNARSTYWCPTCQAG